MLTLVKFFAKWCVPCQKANEIIAPLKEEYKDTVLFTDVDIDDNPQLRFEHHVRQIPTFIIFKPPVPGESSVEVQRMIGCESVEAMRSWLNQYVEGPVDEQGDIQPDVFPEQSGGSDEGGDSVLRSSSEQEDAETGVPENRNSQG